MAEAKQKTIGTRTSEAILVPSEQRGGVGKNPPLQVKAQVRPTPSAVLPSFPQVVSLEKGGVGKNPPVQAQAQVRQTPSAANPPAPPPPAAPQQPPKK
jgi:hypothetical protein